MSLLALTVSASDLPLSRQHAHLHWVSGDRSTRSQEGKSTETEKLMFFFFQKVTHLYAALLKTKICMICYNSNAGDDWSCRIKPNWHACCFLGGFLFHFAIISRVKLRDYSHTHCALNHSTYAVLDIKSVSTNLSDSKIYLPTISQWKLSVKWLPGVSYHRYTLPYVHTVIEHYYAILSVAFAISKYWLPTKRSFIIDILLQPYMQNSRGRVCLFSSYMLNMLFQLPLYCISLFWLGAVWIWTLLCVHQNTIPTATLG